MIYNWKDLPQTTIYKNIINEWKALLEDKSLKERHYHAFLRRHPAVFLTFYGSYVVVSKLKLGSQFETDFVVVKEGYSEGTIYELIEIESPQTKLFDLSGKPTSKFNAALQQIRDWKRWLAENRVEYGKILPTINTNTKRNSRLRYKIVIGRTSDNLIESEKRNQIAEEEGIEIVSFDRLTNLASDRQHFNNETTISSGQMHFDISYEKKNELANPFYQCLTDSQWRNMNYKGEVHFHTNQIDNILKNRSYNQYFDAFKSGQLMDETSDGGL